MSTNIDKTLDTSGLNCPLPILKTKQMLQEMTSGQMLQLIATDKGAIKDIGAFCQMTGNTLIKQTEDDGKYSFIIQKA